MLVNISVAWIQWATTGLLGPSCSRQRNHREVLKLEAALAPAPVPTLPVTTTANTTVTPLEEAQRAQMLEAP